MKFTSKDLMNAMSLKKGDTISITATGLLFSEDIVCKVCSDDNNSAWLETKDSKISLDSLIGMEFKVLPKTVGNTACKDVHCHECPLRMLTCDGVDPDMTLYQCLEYIKEDIGELLDQEIYDLVKARLDKH